MAGALKEDILTNPFISELREMKIDTKAYEKLCSDLKALAQEWKSSTAVDKELVQELFILPTVAKNVADSLAGHRPDLADQIQSMAVTLDAFGSGVLGFLKCGHGECGASGHVPYRVQRRVLPVKSE